MLHPTICQYCGQADSYQHLVSCVNIGGHPQEQDRLVEYLAELASRAYNINPNRPIPISEGADAEIELLPVGGDAESVAGSLDLDFEDDTFLPFDEGTLLAGPLVLAPEQTE